MPNDFNLNEFLMMMAALVICITIHEFAHAYSAYRAGDDTAKLKGRVSLNPLDHLDPFGTIMMIVTTYSGFGFGWGKPVPVNPTRMRHPRWDNLMVSLWGPLSNILLAAVVGTLMRVIVWLARSSTIPALHSSVMVNVVTFLILITVINIGLAIFNLIPIAPLDGSHILSALLPHESARRYDYFMAQYGMIMFFGLIFLGADLLPAMIGPPAKFLMRLFTGMAL